MDWGDIGKLIGGIAPTLGTVLGGPLGGLAGQVIAGTLGVDATPVAVNEALKANPEALARVKEAEAEWAKASAAIAQANAQQGVAVNETIRAEMAAGVSWWHWRHLLGYVFMLWCLLPLGTTMKDMWTGNYVGITNGINLATALSPYFWALAGLLGYVAQDTTRKQIAAVNGTPVGGLADQIGKAVKTLTGKR